jgi:ABC-type sugar transport system permease subunit
MALLLFVMILYMLSFLYEFYKKNRQFLGVNNFKNISSALQLFLNHVSNKHFGVQLGIGLAAPT